MAEVVYLIPDPFEPSKLVVSGEPLGDLFNPPGFVEVTEEDDEGEEPKSADVIPFRPRQ